jgi:HD-GYP domain-containing protein (c-di-GMP phosphodiesterase class II)
MTLELGALLHDVGKIGVNDGVLRKPAKLEPDEWEHMQGHPELGAHMLRDVPFLQASLSCVLYHHERYDGRGYPYRLTGEDIPLEARIVSVADTYDAMTSDRPYRKGLPASVALEEIARCAGSQFDPLVVDAFLRVVEARPLVSLPSA